MQQISALGFIADCYSPALIIFGLALLITRTRNNGAMAGIFDTVAIALSLAFIYALMFADKAIGLWHAATLDYSTHTAFAIVWVLYACITNRRLLPPSIISLVCYFMLMISLQYHSLADIVTTSIAVTPVIYMVMTRMRHRATGPSQP